MQALDERKISIKCISYHLGLTKAGYLIDMKPLWAISQPCNADWWDPFHQSSMLDKLFSILQLYQVFRRYQARLKLLYTFLNQYPKNEGKRSYTSSAEN